MVRLLDWNLVVSFFQVFDAKDFAAAQSILKSHYVFDRVPVLFYHSIEWLEVRGGPPTSICLRDHMECAGPI